MAHHIRQPSPLPAVTGRVAANDPKAESTGASDAGTLKYAGAITFSPEGILFVGDNISSAIFAYDRRGDTIPSKHKAAFPLDVDRIEIRLSSLFKVEPGRVQINGLAVHPKTRQVYLALSVNGCDGLTPAIIRVSASGEIEKVDLTSAPVLRHQIQDPPSKDKHFRFRNPGRRGFWPVPGAEKYAEKARTPMQSMTIVDMKFHNGELFVAGISNEEFASTLRRVRYPFTGEASETQIEIYHTAHALWETRAPIRTMAFATVDGKDTLVAAYTCSPIVLIPVDELRDGAKVVGRTIGDMGNGQPISMVPFIYNGEDMLFVTNLARGPRIIPISGFQNAATYSPENSPNHYRTDMSDEFPLGPVGKEVMFVGSSLRADLLNDKYLVSLTRDALSGNLNLEALPTSPLPIKLDQIWSEFDFEGDY